MICRVLGLVRFRHGRDLVYMGTLCRFTVYFVYFRDQFGSDEYETGKILSAFKKIWPNCEL